MMEVHLCPPTNCGQASCSVSLSEEDNNPLDVKNQVIVNLDESVSTVVYLTDPEKIQVNTERTLDNDGDDEHAQSHTDIKCLSETKDNEEKQHTLCGIEWQMTKEHKDHLIAHKPTNCLYCSQDLQQHIHDKPNECTSQLMCTGLSLNTPTSKSNVTAKGVIKQSTEGKELERPSTHESVIMQHRTGILNSTDDDKLMGRMTSKSRNLQTEGITLKLTEHTVVGNLVKQSHETHAHHLQLLEEMMSKSTNLQTERMSHQVHTDHLKLLEEMRSTSSKSSNLQTERTPNQIHSDCLELGEVRSSKSGNLQILRPGLNIMIGKTTDAEDRKLESEFNITPQERVITQSNECMKSPNKISKVRKKPTKRLIVESSDDTSSLITSKKGTTKWLIVESGDELEGPTNKSNCKVPPKRKTIESTKDTRLVNFTSTIQSTKVARLINPPSTVQSTKDTRPVNPISRVQSTKDTGLVNPPATVQYTKDTRLVNPPSTVQSNKDTRPVNPISRVQSTTDTRLLSPTSTVQSTKDTRPVNPISRVQYTKDTRPAKPSRSSSTPPTKRLIVQSTPGSTVYVVVVKEQDLVKESTFKSSKVLQRHSKKDCSTSTKEEQHINENGKQDGQYLKCTLCSIRCQTAEEYEGHLLSHCDENYSQCPMCEKLFTVKRNFLKHIRAHAGYKPYRCSCCEKTFGQYCHLKQHERIHTGVKPYICKHCNKAFNTSSQLRAHERMHTGSKPYKCDKCDAAFAHGNSLKKHANSHFEYKSMCSI